MIKVTVSVKILAVAPLPTGGEQAIRGSNIMKKILIVDDSREIRQLVGTTLNLEDLIVLEAPDGVTAVKMAQEHIPDLIIMDIIMPGILDGIEAMRRIKDNPKTAHCTIIILSGSRIDRRNECLTAGAIDIFTKPFSPLDLIAKVETVLELQL